MTTARQVADVLESIAPIESGIPGDELGFLWGDPNAPVRGVACMWNAHTTSLREAIRRDLNFLLVHEEPFYHVQQSHWYKGPEREEKIIANQKRRALVEQHKLVIYRSHSNWDALAVDGVPDQAVRALGINSLKVVGQQKYFKVHQLPRPMTVAELAERARVGLEMPWSPRIFGDATKSIRRFTFLVGGFGGNQIHTPQAAHELGAEAIIVGEMLEWITINSLECDMPVIETLHSLSEIPALKRQAALLAERLPGVRVEYLPSGALAMGTR